MNPSCLSQGLRLATLVNSSFSILTDSYSIATLNSEQSIHWQSVAKAALHMT